MFWRGVWGYLPANIIQGVAGFLTIILFTRLLTPEQYGQYALAFSVMTLSHVIVFTWIEAAMARFWASEKTPEGLAAHHASLYGAVFRLTALFLPVAVAVIAVLPLDGAFKLALGIAVCGVPVRSIARLAQEHYRAAGMVSKAAAVDIWNTVVGLGVGAVFALAHFGAAAPHLGLMLAPLAALPFLLPGELRRARAGAIEPARLRTYAAYGFPIAAGLGLSVALASIDRFFLAVFMDEAAVGAYHAGYSIANRTLDVLFVWLGAAGAPALIMALERGGAEPLRQAAREQASTLILIGLPAAVGVALVARPLAELMVGPDLREAAMAVTPIIALSALFVGATTHYFGQAFTLSRRTDLLLVTVGVPAVANLALNVVLIPRFGLMGAAWATLLSYMIGMAVCVGLGRRILKLPTPWGTLWRCLVAAAVMGGVVWSLPSIGGLFELILDAGVGAVVYAVIALMLNAAGVRDVALRLLAKARHMEIS